MTLRQYWADAYLTSFTATVIETIDHKGQPALILDQTAFYPTSGGQPHDTGTLNGLEVQDVIELEDRRIAHILSSSPHPPISPAQQVRGELHWSRRFDHMQQHSGQHVLSQAFIATANLETLAVHIGTDDCTLDLPGKLTPAQLETAEGEANTLVFANRPINAYEVAFDELSRVPLRKPPKKSADGKVRIVEVQGYDWSACGGTHVRSTAEIGPIKLIKAEKRSNDSRVTFRCGWRALRDYARLNRDVTQMADAFTVARYDLGDAIARLRAESQLNKKMLSDATDKLMTYECAELLANTPPDADGRIVILKAFADRDMNSLRVMAKSLTSRPNVLALLASAGEKSALCFARSENLTDDASKLLRSALSKLGDAKGGGSPNFAQGGGAAASTEQLVSAMQESWNQSTPDP
jgi:alanyl-tRNA synthetase